MRVFQLPISHKHVDLDAIQVVTPVEQGFMHGADMCYCFEITLALRDVPMRLQYVYEAFHVRMTAKERTDAAAEACGFATVDHDALIEAWKGAAADKDSQFD